MSVEHSLLCGGGTQCASDRVRSVPALGCHAASVHGGGTELSLQHLENRQRIAQAPRESTDGSDPQRYKAALQRRREVAKLIDAGKSADRGAFTGVKEPRPQLNRKLTLPPRSSSDHLQHRLGHHVEHKQRAGQTFGDSRDQHVDLIALEVGKEALRGDQDRVRRIQLVKPLQIECRSGMARMSRAIAQEPVTKLHGLGQVHGQPPHLTVVQPPELGLQPLAEGNHRAARIGAQETANRLIEGGHPNRMQPRPARDLREVVIKSVNDLNGHWVLQSPNACSGGPAPEIPKQRLRYPSQVYRDRLHGPDRSVVPDERPGRRACDTSFRAQTSRSADLPASFAWRGKAIDAGRVHFARR